MPMRFASLEQTDNGRWSLQSTSYGQREPATLPWLSCSRRPTGTSSGRATGHAGDLSDWDTVLFWDDDAGEADVIPGSIDDVFGVERAAPTGNLDLTFHVASRRVGAVDIEVMGPSIRAKREEVSLAEWAYQLRYAVALSDAAGTGPAYVAHVANSFDQRTLDLAAAAYGEFRRTRNEAVSTLPREDKLAQQLTAAACLSTAARFWILAGGDPHPTEKWLMTVLRSDPGATELVTAMEVAGGVSPSAADRFDALLDVWRLVDARARDAGMDERLLAGSPF